MNIINRGFEIEETIIEQINENFKFLKELSNKEVTLNIHKEKDCYRLKIFFNIDESEYIIDTRSKKLKEGLYRLKTKAMKHLESHNRALKGLESIRKPEKIDRKKNYEFKYSRIETLDKPMQEKDVKKFMLGERISTILFQNLDKDNCLCIMQNLDKEFSLYITDIYIH